MKKILLVAAATAFSTAAFAADMPQRAPMPAKAYAAPASSWTGCYAGIAGGWDRVDSGESANGGLVGGTLGCNVQTGNWVYGIEGDALWNGIDKDVLTANIKQDFLGSVRGRLGVATPTTLLYGTGGLGIGHLKVFDPGVIDFSDTQTGWVAGGGFEWVVAPNWTAKIEYLHYNFDVDGGALGASTYKVDSVKVGLNYQFGH